MSTTSTSSGSTSSSAAGSSGGAGVGSSWLGTFFNRVWKQTLSQAETPALASGGNGLASVAPGTGMNQTGSGYQGGLWAYLQSLLGLPNIMLAVLGLLLIAAGIWSLSRR